MGVLFGVIQTSMTNTPSEILIVSYSDTLKRLVPRLTCYSLAFVKNSIYYIMAALRKSSHSMMSRVTTFTNCFRRVIVNSACKASVSFLCKVEKNWHIHIEGLIYCVC